MPKPHKKQSAIEIMKSVIEELQEERPITPRPKPQPQPTAKEQTDA